MATRVLLGDLEPIAVLGMTAVLGEAGIEVVGTETRQPALVLLAGGLRPDAVVLDRASRVLAARVRAASPGTTVVLWARDEAAMEVLPPGGGAPRRADPGELCGELQGLSSRRAPA